MDYTRRQYLIEGETLKEQTITVLAGGKKVFEFQARKPGLAAFVCRPDDGRLALEIVEPGARLSDNVGEGSALRLEPWQQLALGL